jgi:hypothetical protein
MSDYTIVGWSAVKRVLELVQPYTVFKREQVDRALDIMFRFGDRLNAREFLEAAKLVDAFAALNYSKKKHIDAQCVEAFLSGKGLLVPVTTEVFDNRDRARLPCNQLANLPP